MNAEANFEHTLACVRELSENATVRPAPKILRCVPLTEFMVPPAPPAWKFRREMLLEKICVSSVSICG